ncbi:MAG TPA: hypothetical protein VLL57_12120, partial [Candidatus Binataceae bacterium]|nr:hypothetical protein [Candidatus Binataceae bacterium]
LGRITLSLGVTAYLSMVYIFIFAMPAAEVYRGEKPFAYQVRELVGGQILEVWLYRTVGPLFYLDPLKPLAEFDRPKDLAAAVANGSVKWVIVRRRDLPSIGMPTEIMASEAMFPWESQYQHRNKVVLVRLGVNSHGS